MGEGLVGQAAVDRQRLLLTDIPPDSIQVRGGLLSARPHTVIVLPVLYEGHVKAVVELVRSRASRPRTWRSSSS